MPKPLYLAQNVAYGTFWDIITKLGEDEQNVALWQITAAIEKLPQVQSHEPRRDCLSG